MKAVITADIHGNYSAWQEVLALLDKEDLLIIAGDLFGDRYPPPSDQMFMPELIAADFKHLKNIAYIVKGNCDLAVYLKELPVQKRFELFCREIFLTHGNRSELFAPNSYQIQPFDIYISGHSHYPKIEKNESYLTINPGSAAQPGSANRTVAFLYQDHVVLYELDNKEIIEQLDLD